MEPAGPIETAHLFPALHAELAELLRGLGPEDWEKPTVAGSWRVRDVAAHLLDTQLRRISAGRDGHGVLPPGAPVLTDRELASRLHSLNAEWVVTARRFSTRVLLDLLESTAPALAAHFASLDPRGFAIFPVSWAGQSASENWLDTGREYTERWHHQAQIRDAVGAPLLDRRDLFLPVVEISLYALPVAFRGLKTKDGSAVVVDVTGPAGGTWTLRRERGTWTLWRGESGNSVVLRARMEPDAAWRLFFNALPATQARMRMSIEGDRALAERFLTARGVVV